MPTSPYAHIYCLVEFLNKMRPASLLDIGVGNGKLGFIARDLLDVMLGERYKREDWQLKLDGIEAFGEYIQDHQRAIYNSIIIGDAFEKIDDLESYDMVLLGDVLEHFDKEKGWQFLDKCFAHTEQAVALFIPLGKGWTQPAIYNNPYERHRSSWFQDDFTPMCCEHEIYHYQVGPYGAFLIKKNQYITQRLESLKKTPYFPETHEDPYGIRKRYRLSKDQIAHIDLNKLSRFAASAEYRAFFLDKNFKEHYRLLSHLSSQYQNSIIFDIGTFKGYSALALSYEPTNLIVSYDIQDHKDLHERNNISTIEFNIGNALNDPRLLQAPLILLDTNHDGGFEMQVYTFLKNNGYQGLLVLDDIYLNAEMMRFWEHIDLPKEDVTDLGHWSGTGIVDFIV
jgi:hypothetical protein